MGNCMLKTKFDLSFARFFQAREDNERKGHNSWDKLSPVPKVSKPNFSGQVCILLLGTSFTSKRIESSTLLLTAKAIQ